MAQQGVNFMDCVATVVKNTSGGTRFFPYLGVHGAELADDDTYEVLGDLWSYIPAVHPGIKGRRLMALAYVALLNGDIELVSCPSCPCNVSSSESGDEEPQV